MKFRSLAVWGLMLIGAVGSMTAAPPFRLFEIYAIRYINDGPTGPVIAELGAYNALGEFRHHSYQQLSAGTTIPAELMNKPLLPFNVWPAYDVLGQEALANFKLDATLIGSSGYWQLSVADQPKVDVGALMNISARGTVSPGGEPLFAGFVVDEHSRRVLIRGIGPALAMLNVATPLSDPMITLYRLGGQAAVGSNDDWGSQANAAEIESTAAVVGAFPLPRTSKDAALLVRLEPGAYTALLTSASGTGGSALLEVYIIP